MPTYRTLAGIVSAAVMVVSSAGMASAGSLKDDPVNIPMSWNGIYVGAHAGYGRSGVDSLQRGTFWSCESGLFESNTSGRLVGAQLGYNFQAGQLVFGGEMSYSGALMDDADPSPCGRSDHYSADIDRIVTITGRVGYSISNQTLLYIKGGYAAANIEVTNDDLVSGLPVGSRNNRSVGGGWYGGWTVGGGVEQKLAPRLSLALDYNMIDLGAKTISMTNTGSIESTPAWRHIDARVSPDTMHTLTARLNFKLGK